jgi:hypothetical protein
MGLVEDGSVMSGWIPRWVGAGVGAMAVVAVGCGSMPASSNGAESPGSRSLASPVPSTVTGHPSPVRYAGAGHRYMRPGFVSETVVFSSRSRLVLQAPPGVVRWSLNGVSCRVDYKMIKKTPWGGVRGSGGGSGGAVCPWAPHLSLSAAGDQYSRGVLFTQIGGKVLPATGVRIRVRLAGGATMTVMPHHAMWLVIVQRCGGYKKTAIRSVELLSPNGSVIARKVVKSGTAAQAPC